MSLTIEQTWDLKFNDMLMETYQQKASLLTGMLDPGMVHYNIKAQIDHHERLGALVANDVISPTGPTNVMNIEHSKRAVTLQSSDAVLRLSDENTLRSLIDPQSAYRNAIAYALARRDDVHIINALLGSAQIATVTAGSGIITYSSVALPAARKIGAATAIDLARIIAASEGLSKAGAPPGLGRRKFLYSPGQERDLLAITQASSSDFTKNQIHDRGTISGLPWEGFDWIMMQDLIGTDGVVANALLRMLPLASTTRSCLAFDVSCVGLSVGRDVTTYVNELPEHNNSIQVRSVMAKAAVRVWEGGVMQVDTLEN